MNLQFLQDIKEKTLPQMSLRSEKFAQINSIYEKQILICGDTGCRSSRSDLVEDEVREAIASAPGCKLYDDSNSNKYPMPVITSNQDIVYVGRLREDLADEKGINLWCCGDQVRKGAATNAIQIAELLI